MKLVELGRTIPSTRPRSESVLQFGTGGFLRGFAEYFVQKANQKGRFTGSVVVVGSTGSGRIQSLERQDGLYTLIVRGREAGRVVDESEIVSVISRAVSARNRWAEVLAVARDPHLRLIISNTTEVGIVLDEDDRHDLNPPRSFPGKLTAVLFERAQAFDFDMGRGLIVLPCELIDGNGDTLRSIVLALADRWHLGDTFKTWVSTANTFCNTLVDRIVSGIPRDGEADEIEQRLGYRDALMTVAEPYRLWAVEGDDAFAQRFPLTGVDPGIVVTDDIGPYRERKVRILNGTHTAMVPVAILAGFETVADAVGDPIISKFVERLVFREIVPSLSSDPAAAKTFGEEVVERFSNPFIHHKLIDITFQQTRKLRLRVIPSLVSFAERFGALPPAITLGFAGFLIYNHPSRKPNVPKAPKDDAEVYWEAAWRDRSPGERDDVAGLVETVARDEDLWGCRLDILDGFVEQVVSDVLSIERTGVDAVLKSQ